MEEKVTTTPRTRSDLQNPNTPYKDIYGKTIKINLSKQKLQESSSLHSLYKKIAIISEGYNQSDESLAKRKTEEIQALITSKLPSYKELLKLLSKQDIQQVIDLLDKTQPCLIKINFPQGQAADETPFFVNAFFLTPGYISNIHTHKTNCQSHVVSTSQIKEGCYITSIKDNTDPSLVYPALKLSSMVRTRGDNAGIRIPDTITAIGDAHTLSHPSKDLSLLAELRDILQSSISKGQSLDNLPTSGLERLEQLLPASFHGYPGARETSVEKCNLYKAGNLTSSPEREKSSDHRSYLARELKTSQDQLEEQIRKKPEDTIVAIRARSEKPFSKSR